MLGLAGSSLVLSGRPPIPPEEANLRGVRRALAEVSERRGDKAEAEHRLRRSREAEAQGPR